MVSASGFEVVLFAPDLAQLRLYRMPLGLATGNHPACQGDVFLEAFMGAVDHNRGVPGPHRLHRQIKAISMIEVKRNRHIDAFGGRPDVGSNRRSSLRI